MRGLRSFLGLLVILIALGAYLYFVESKRDPTDSAEKREKVFTVEADKIEEVTIKSASGDRTTLRKSGSDWQITAPAPAQADSGEISGITSSLSTLEQQRVIDENPSNPAEFGLGDPRIQVTFKVNGQEQRLLIGSKTPTGSDLYARTAAQPKVFLIASYLESTFNRTTFDLRDKTALRFDREKTDALEVTAADKTLKFAKANGEWQIVQPTGYRADAAAIEGLVSRLSGLQMKTLVEAEAADLKKYGLDKPAATVRIGTGSSQATFLVGSSAKEGTVHAKDVSRPAVFTVESSLLDDLKKDAGEYRQKDIFDARAFNTTSVEIVRGTERTVFEKKENKWRQSAPAQKDADQGKVDSLLTALTGARADSFVDATPAAAKPEVTVALKSDEGRKEERVTFSRAGSDAFAARAGSTGAAKIAASALDGIVKAIDEAKK